MTEFNSLVEPARDALIDEKARRDSIKKSTKSSATQREWQRNQSVLARPLDWKLIGVFLGVFTLVIFWVLPWPYYQWAAHQDTIPAYKTFLLKYPHGDYANSARERIRVLHEDAVWASVETSDDIRKTREYLRVYPEGKHTNTAKRLTTRIADRQWDSVATSRSEVAIRRFLTDFPETSHVQDAEARIHSLYNNFTWVQEQGTLDAYKRYLEGNSNSPNRAFVEKKIIDLEVAVIAAGEHDYLPEAQLLDFYSNSSYASVRVQNSTGYELTVRYSGPDSQKATIPVGGTQSLRLPTGSYTIAASVSASRTRNYVGTHAYHAGGNYGSRFYIIQGH